MPHITLTSDIKPETYGDSPQQWLDDLVFPEDFQKEHVEVVATLYCVEAEEEWNRKLYLNVSEDGNLTRLAARCRREAVIAPTSNGSTNGVSTSNGDANGSHASNSFDQEASRWASETYQPHVSLLYSSDLTRAEAQKRVGTVELQVGFAIGDLFACCGRQLAGGGSVVLVDTSVREDNADEKLKQDVEGWKVLAERKVGWVVWMLDRNLA